MENQAGIMTSNKRKLLQVSSEIEKSSQSGNISVGGAVKFWIYEQSRLPARRGTPIVS